MTINKYKLIKKKAFKGNRFKKIAYTLKGIFPNNNIIGDRVLLRPPRRRDWKNWVKLRISSYDYLKKWEPYWEKEKCNRSSYMRQLRMQRTRAAYDQAYNFLCFKKLDKTLIGGINISNIQRGVIQTGNIGYWIGEDFASNGYMYESISTLLPFIFNQIKLNRIQAYTLEENYASRNLLQKLGFKNEGVLRKSMKIDNKWRDHILYSKLYSDDYD